MAATARLLTSQQVIYPTITVFGGTPPTFTGGGAPAQLYNGNISTGGDNISSLTGATVTIASVNFLAGDTLNFVNQNGISGNYNSSTGVLTLTGSASFANYNTALESITYSFNLTNGDPTNGGVDTTRTINWEVFAGSLHSTPASTSTSTLDTAHAPPTVTAGSTATYPIGGSGTALDSTLTVADPDSGGNLAGATVSIATGFQSGDSLNFTNQNGITGSYNSTTGVLTVSSTTPQSIANYQAFLETVTFSTTVGTAGSRTIDWTVNDGVANSTVVSSTVNIEPGITADETIYISSSVTSSGLDVLSGGAVVVLPGGTDDTTTVSSGGSLTVSSGGVASNAIISAGGSSTVFGGGSTVSALLVGSSSAFGIETLSGGTAIATTVSSGGNLDVLSGGTASNTTVSGGGFESVSSGGITVSSLLVGSGSGSGAAFGVETLSGGTASNTSVSSGGNLNVSSGGIASSTTVSGGGGVDVTAGGTTVSSLLEGTSVSAFGNEFVLVRRHRLEHHRHCVGCRRSVSRLRWRHHLVDVDRQRRTAWQ